MKKCYDCTHVEMCGWRKEVEEQGCEFFDDGMKIPVEEMTTSHIKNTIAYIERKDKYDLYEPWLRVFRAELESREKGW